MFFTVNMYLLGLKCDTKDYSHNNLRLDKQLAFFRAKPRFYTLLSNLNESCINIAKLPDFRVQMGQDLLST